MLKFSVADLYEKKYTGTMSAREAWEQKTRAKREKKSVITFGYVPRMDR